MPTLIEEIEMLRGRLNASHAEEMEMTRSLRDRIETTDAALAAEIDGMIRDHEHRRGGIVQALTTLAARIGYLPGGVAPAHTQFASDIQPLPLVASPQPMH